MTADNKCECGSDLFTQVVSLQRPDPAQPNTAHSRVMLSCVACGAVHASTRKRAMMRGRVARTNNEWQRLEFHGSEGVWKPVPE